MINAFESLAIALVLTIVLEWLVIYLFGLRKKTDFLAILFINLLTNPLMNYFILVMQSLHLITFNLFSILVVELIVVIAEWRLLIYSVSGNQKKLFVISLVMNLFSFSFGLILSFFFSPPFMRFF
jgi:hypothetical protein